MQKRWVIMDCFGLHNYYFKCVSCDHQYINSKSDWMSTKFSTFLGFKIRKEFIFWENYSIKLMTVLFWNQHTVPLSTNTSFEGFPLPFEIQGVNTGPECLPWSSSGPHIICDWWALCILCFNKPTTLILYSLWTDLINQNIINWIALNMARHCLYVSICHQLFV